MDHVYADLNGVSAMASKGASWAASKGILVVNSAGNWGGSSWNYIGVPADADSILATGAVDSMENLAGFSSRGPSADGRIKPDVSAQGVDVVMSSTSGAIMTGNGTSFSCPLISGAAACLWQANPSLTAMQIRDVIIQSCDQYLNPDNNKGYGIPDFGQALFVLNGKRLVKPDSDAVVSCYPNPTQNKLHVALFSGSSQPIGILLCDLSGRVIDQILTSALPDSYHHFNIDMADLSSGLYLLKVDFRDSDQVIKIVRQ
jgi:subtilisin family serine protease